LNDQSAAAINTVLDNLAEARGRPVLLACGSPEGAAAVGVVAQLHQAGYYGAEQMAALYQLLLVDSAPVRSVAAGVSVTRDDVALLRPGTGIAPVDFDRVPGMKAVRDLPAGTTLTWADLA
jgi:hypothetical protein